MVGGRGAPAIVIGVLLMSEFIGSKSTIGVAQAAFESGAAALWAVLTAAIAFLLFRFFDIVKPPPIRQLDAAMKNGTGVMLDDLLAAVYTLLAFAVWKRLAE